MLIRERPLNVGRELPSVELIFLADKFAKRGLFRTSLVLGACRKGKTRVGRQILRFVNTGVRRGITTVFPRLESYAAKAIYQPNQFTLQKKLQTQSLLIHSLRS